MGPSPVRAAVWCGFVRRTSACSLKECCGEVIGVEGRCAQGPRIEDPAATFCAPDGELWYRERRDLRSLAKKERVATE